MEGLLDGNVESDSDRCVALSSRSAIEELILPLVYSILSPVLIGLLIGPGPLAGMLIGTISSGMVLSFMMSNAGGAWNNAQKCVEDENICGGSGSVTHKACVTGSTVGDPFRDTIGPAINCLMKMVCTVSLTMAPIIKNRPSWQIWYYGLIPLGLILFVTLSVYFIYSRTTVDVSAPIQVSGSPRRKREE
jgi:K(+)-stimulated pyrophosphate-energized sodium pump